MAVGYCWVFHIKHKVDGTLKRYKACLVVKGYIYIYIYIYIYMLVLRIDFTKIFSLVVKMSSI